MRKIVFIARRATIASAMSVSVIAGLATPHFVEGVCLNARYAKSPFVKAACQHVMNVVNQCVFHV